MPKLMQVDEFGPQLYENFEQVCQLPSAMANQLIRLGSHQAISDRASDWPTPRHVCPQVPSSRLVNAFSSDSVARRKDLW